MGIPQFMAGNTGMYIYPGPGSATPKWTKIRCYTLEYRQG